MKKLTAMVLACLMLAGILSGCASTANDEEVEYRWKMALNSTEGDNAYDTGVLFAQKIKELTDKLIDAETAVHVATVQGMMKRIMYASAVRLPQRTASSTACTAFS